MHKQVLLMTRKLSIFGNHPAVSFNQAIDVANQINCCRNDCKSETVEDK